MDYKSFLQEMKTKFKGDAKRISNLAMLVLGMAVLCATTIRVVVPALVQGQGLWQARQQQRMKLQQLQSFAARHADYNAYEEGRYKELVRLKQRVQQFRDGNELQRQLQLGAIKQRLLLKNMQIVQDASTKNGSTKEAKQLQSVQLKLELAGEYGSLLRWLKQLEQQRLAVQALEIKGQGVSTVQASLVLRGAIMTSK